MRYSCKTFFFILGLWINTVSAQILNIEKLSPSLNLAPEFLDHLENCTSYSGEKSAFLDESDTRLAYKVERQGQKCALNVTADTDHYVHIEQSCLLPLQTAATYAGALRRFNAKKYSLFKDTFAINKDEDYKIAKEIMQNSDFCKFKRLEIDNTKNIRENLPDCHRTESEESVENAKIFRKIDGRDENFNCRYYYTLWRPQTVIEKKPFANVRNLFVPTNEMKFSYVCSFDEAQKKEYLLLLESLVLPEEEGYNFTSVSTFSSKIELEFIVNNCEYIISDIK